MSIVANEHSIHITIASTPAIFPEGKSGVDLTGDLEMVKAAVLYADQATLCSPACSALFDGTNLVNLSTSERISFIEMMPLWFPSESQLVNQARELFARYREAWSQRHTKNGYLFLKRFEREMNKRWDQIVAPFTKLLNESGGSEISRAIESGLLDMHRFQSPLNRIMIESERDAFLQEFVSVVGSTVSNQATYPLFDNRTSNLISAGIAARVIPLSEAAVAHGKEVALAADLFTRLPVFPSATMDEVLDIRRELDQSLCRFRSAMIAFSDGIKDASWDKDFSFSAEQVFRRDVAPAILTLEEDVKSNSFLSKFMSKLSERSFQVGTAITGSAAVSALIASISNLPLPEVATLALGPSVTLGGVAYGAYVDWKKDNQNIQQNNLFFYYRTGTLLEDRTYEYVDAPK